MTATDEGLQRLAGGRRAAGGLSAAEVVSHQRARLLRAVAEVVATKGYADTTVTDVIAAAGVSRATFYEQFSDKLDCFLAAFSAASARIFGGLASSVPRGGAATTLGDLIGAYLGALVADPVSARVFLVDIHAAGPAGIALRADGQKRFAAAIAKVLRATSDTDRFACEAFVAAVGALVSVRIAADDLDGVRALRGPLTELAGRLMVQPSAPAPRPRSRG